MPEELEDILEEEKEETPQEEVPKEPTVSPEALELFNSVREEVGEKRFDGLMSAWQEDRRRMLNLEEELGSLRTEQETAALEKTAAKIEKPVEGEEWIDYLRTRMKDRDLEEQRLEDEYVATELNAALSDFPGLSDEEILRFAVKHSDDENNPMSLYTAAEILTEMREGGKTAKELIAEEQRRKREAATGISGGTEITTPPGLRPWREEKDKGKSLRDLGREGSEELGM